MKIYRDGKAIELTEQEICDIYYEARRRNYVDDVLVKLSEDYNIDPSKENVDVQMIASDIMNEIMDNDTIWNCEQDVFDRVIEQYLKEKGLR
jgi:hypothetical protein